MCPGNQLGGLRLQHSGRNVQSGLRARACGHRAMPLPLAMSASRAPQTKKKDPTVFFTKHKKKKIDKIVLTGHKDIEA